MPRKKKETHWWQKEVFLDDDKFSNTVRKHNEKQASLFKGEGEEDYDSLYEDYGYDRKLSDRDDEDRDEDEMLDKINQLKQIAPGMTGSINQFVAGRQQAKKKESGIKSDWWEEYRKTGKWMGYNYYKTPQLSYRYIQQMANAIAAQHDITIKVENEWRVDLKTKTLTYNPLSLMYGTKGELLATLLHEVGKLKHSSPYDELKGKYLTEYKERAYEASLVFEDLRVDMKMLKAYPSAPEVYESQGKTMEEYVNNYVERGDMVRGMLAKIAVDNYNKYISVYENSYHEWLASAKFPNIPTSKSLFDSTAGAAYTTKYSPKYLGRSYNNIHELQMEVQMAIKSIPHTPMLEDYLAVMYKIAYDAEGRVPKVDVTEFAEKTKDFLLTKSHKYKSQQELIEAMEAEVYPHIAQLLRNSEGASQEIMKAMPGLAQAFREKRDQYLDQMGAGAKGNQVGVRKGGQNNARGKGEEHIPNTWTAGDYKALKESVEADIKSLVNRLTFLRREEQVIRYEGNQRRGKLDSKKLYRARFGIKKVFKRKIPSTDTVRSFAFSIMLDTSGSMSGPRIVHSTRSLIVFAEVFNKMQIPFELITYEDDATIIKGFEQSYDNDMKRKIAGLVTRSGGGTELHEGLKKVGLKKREEKNKILMVLTDGDVGPIKPYNEKYFQPMRDKDGIKSIGIGIETDDYMKELCNGNTILVDNANKIPMEFVTLLKDLIRR